LNIEYDINIDNYFCYKSAVVLIVTGILKCTTANQARPSFSRADFPSKFCHVFLMLHAHSLVKISVVT